MASKGRQLASLINNGTGNENKVIGYDENGELSELEEQYVEDDYIVDELVDYQWNS